MPPATNISHSWYHSVLRVSVLVFAVALVFESGILSSATASITHTAGQQVASTIEATIDSASYSEETGAIMQVQNTGSAEVNSSPSDTLSKSTFLLSIVVFILLLLIILNYILDHLRIKERQLRIS